MVMFLEKHSRASLKNQNKRKSGFVFHVDTVFWTLKDREYKKNAKCTLFN